MIYRGTVRYGVVVLPPDVHLPHVQDVTVQSVESQSTPAFAASWRESIAQGRRRMLLQTGLQVSPDLHLVNELRCEAKL